MPNLLVSTFGATWAVGAELIALSAYPEMLVLSNNDSVKSFYQKHLRATERIDEVWLICTHGKITDDAIGTLIEWLELFPELSLPEIKYLSLSEIEDLTTVKECNEMSDFIYRIVMQAKAYKKEGKLFLSLTGGRKTMSTDMQRAADIFGCDVLFHLADNGIGQYDDKKKRINNPQDFYDALPKEEANKLFLVEVLNDKNNHFITEIEPPILSSDYPVEFSRNNNASIELFNEINKRLNKSESLLYNAYRIRTGETNQSIFHGLQQLSPAKLQRLSNEQPNETWLRLLPKTELHFHFGGILTVDELIETALVNQQGIDRYLAENGEFKTWFDTVSEAVNRRNTDYLLPFIQDKEKLRKNTFSVESIKPPYTVSAFVSAFKDDSSYLEELIFGKYLNDIEYQNIGIEAYEKLGDLQGSALMQSRESIEKVCDYLLNYCNQQHLKYLELRCSPCNYTYGGLTEWEVVQIMYNKLFRKPNCDIRLILIGSRHGDMDVFRSHVKLAQNMLKDDKLRDFIIGFDVAGNESVASPAELRDLLLPLMLECLHITIHAGENRPVTNIWEAVYELNADRIGHGLTLPDNKDLMKRFRDRNIFIELCPSSNFQISDFRSGDKQYPLREFMDAGLKVTLNTDNPGISRTTITEEYLRMVQYADLSKLEVLQLLRNSFQGCFLPKDEKKKLLVEVENELYELISKEEN